jgi:hypothetical protein
LRPEETTFGTFDDLLVYGGWWMVHYDGAIFVIDLGINACITDKVDDPFLALVLAKT